MTSVNSIESIEDITELAMEKKGVIAAYMETLPEKALGLGLRVVLAIFFIFIGRLLINLLRKICSAALLKAGVDKGVRQFLDSFLSIVLWIVLIMTIAVNNGIDAASVVAILGSAGLAIGLSLQGALSNFAGGILILLLKPFRIGDYIIENASGMEGRVTEINVFYTHLKTIDNRVVVVPNGKLADTSLVNVTGQDKRLLDLRFGISYTADIGLAKKVMGKVVEENGLVMDSEPVDIFVNSLDDSAVTLGLRAWVKTEVYWKARWGITESVKLAFDEAGIEIPYSQVDIHIRSDGAASSDAATGGSASGSASSGSGSGSTTGGAVGGAAGGKKA